MRKYEAILNGENFLLLVDGARRKMGFYVTRYVEAESPQQAEETAISMIWESRKLQGQLLNSRGDPPRVYLDELYEIESFADLETLEPGFGFYSEEAGEAEEKFPPSR